MNNSQHFQNINQILKNFAEQKKVKYDWIIDFNQEVKEYDFYRQLFTSYRHEKLKAYKKIFDYCYSQNIDLFQFFHQIFCIHHPNKILSNNSELLDLIPYVIQKKYSPLNYDFSVFFNIYYKTTKTNYLAQYKLLPYLDKSEKSLLIHIQLFQNYLKTFPMFSVEEQKNIQKIFEPFQQYDFYQKYLLKIQNFYPSLLQVKNISAFEQNSFFSKKISLSYHSEIPKMEEILKNNIENIYETIFTKRKQDNMLDDFVCISQNGYFLLYLFSNQNELLYTTTQALEKFHQNIQLELQLQSNPKEQDYYIKLFDSLYLEESLQKPQKNIQSLSLKI